MLNVQENVLKHQGVHGLFAEPTEILIKVLATCVLQHVELEEQFPLLIKAIANKTLIAQQSVVEKVKHV